MGKTKIREIEELQNLFSGIVMNLRRVPHRKMLPGHITFVQMRVLWLLESGSPCTMGEVAQTLSVTRPTATAIVNRLVSRGFIARERDTKDRRVVNLKMRPRGTAFLATRRRLFRERLEQMLEPLSQSERKRLLTALKVVNKAVQMTSLDNNEWR
jgi:DNA-binding MarR family transcriptional regulator